MDTRFLRLPRKATSSVDTLVIVPCPSWVGRFKGRGLTLALRVITAAGMHAEAGGGGELVEALVEPTR